MNILVGADPEFFVQRNRHFISGHIFPCGTKAKPRQMEKGAVQVDGIALEINVKPSATRLEFIQNVTDAKNELEGFIQACDQKVKLVAAPSIFFGRNRLSKLPSEIAALGCTPDFNAYTCGLNPRPNDDSPIRTGAGHIHLGFTQNENVKSRKYIELCCGIVKQLDFYLGLPSLLWDSDNRRRTLYGQAGAFRPKPYGLEYRVLSNKWTENETHIGWIFDQTVRAFRMWSSGDILWNRYGDMAKDLINSGDSGWRKKLPLLATELVKP